MKNYMIANWKMNKVSKEAGIYLDKIIPLVKDSKNSEIVICAPYTLLHIVKEKIKDSNIKLGAQDVFYENFGAYTGEISAPMLIDAGCKYVIVGHSERRSYFNETNELINRKLKAALDNGLIPILCVGENLKQREEGKTEEVIEMQLESAIKGINKQIFQKTIVAYEPIWAIGTGKNATPVQIQETHLFIKEFLAKEFGKQNKMPVIYGGSVSPDNIKEIMVQEAVNGVLVGGASLDAEKFAKIINY